MASEQTQLEYSLVDTQNKLNFFKNKLSQDQNPVYQTWIEIYTSRLEDIKRKLGKAN